MEPYYKLVPYAITEDTKHKILNFAYAPDAFVDISYKISFFKLPSTIQHFNTTGLDCVCQMLKVNESGSTIHKDNNRHNEFDGTWIPRQTVVSFALTENCGSTHFFDDNKKLVCDINYEGHGAILNTGEHYHNVHFEDTNNERIVFQFCFEESFDQVCKLWNNIKI